MKQAIQILLMTILSSVLLSCNKNTANNPGKTNVHVDEPIVIGRVLQLFYFDKKTGKNTIGIGTEHKYDPYKIKIQYSTDGVNFYNNTNGGPTAHDTAIYVVLLYLHENVSGNQTIKDINFTLYYPIQLDSNTHDTLRIFKQDRDSIRFFYNNSLLKTIPAEVETYQQLNIAK